MMLAPGVHPAHPALGPCDDPHVPPTASTVFVVDHSLQGHLPLLS